MMHTMTYADKIRELTTVKLIHDPAEFDPKALIMPVIFN